MLKAKQKDILEYILFQLPIFSDTNDLSLEDIEEEFSLNTYNPEATQEEIADFILKNSD